MTEKQESQGSCRHISELERGESREKSQKSEEKRRLNTGGQTRLKEMLRNRGLMVKEQGRKERIIKLDSIEEENANY